MLKKLSFPIRFLTINLLFSVLIVIALYGYAVIGYLKNKNDFEKIAVYCKNLPESALDLYQIVAPDGGVLDAESIEHNQKVSSFVCDTSSVLVTPREPKSNIYTFSVEFPNGLKYKITKEVKPQNPDIVWDSDRDKSSWEIENKVPTADDARAYAGTWMRDEFYKAKSKLDSTFDDAKLFSVIAISFFTLLGSLPLFWQFILARISDVSAAIRGKR